MNFLHEDLFNIVPNSTTKFEPDRIVKRINKIRVEKWFTDTVDYIPPPFFVSKLQFADNSYFDELSSGEKQKIYFLNSIIYHLKNIDSVHRNNYKNQENIVVTYTAVNLILDEIELYYHPNFQKNIIYDLLDFLKKAEFEFVKNINILFLTHSPFILSDIPHQNILKLKNGRNDPYMEQKKSFGANIYSLLDDSFFMDNTMGKFAETKMKKVLETLSDNNQESFFEANKFQLRQTIEMIGEPMIREQLENLYRTKFDQDELGVLKSRIKDLEEELKKNKIDSSKN